MFNKYSILLFSLLLSIENHVFARAGGGFGGGGGGFRGGFSSGGYHYYGRGGSGKFSWIHLIIIVSIIVIVGVAIFYSIVLYKNKKKKIAAKIINESNLTDQLWNKTNLEDHVKKVYLLLQDAWQKQDLMLINQYITQHFFAINDRILENQREENIINFIKVHKIESVEIIGAQDFKDNDYDRFSVLIKVYLYEYYTFNGVVNENTRKDGTIEEILHFARLQNKWLLDGIQADVSVNGISLVRNYKE